MDLDIRRVLAAKPGEPEEAVLEPLTTVWGETLDASNVLGEYPRPTMRRARWTNLNGWWEYAIVESSAAQDMWSIACPPKVWDGTILVPFSPESRLSGVGRTLLPTQLLWYRRSVTMEEGEPDEAHRMLLHFGAVDYACACYVNGKRIAKHVGGYLPFCVDITDAMHAGSNTIELCVADPSEKGTQLRGKQRLRRGNMWYTAQSGIWQTVWMEQVPSRHIKSVAALPNADAGKLCVRVEVSEPGSEVSVEALDANGSVVGTGSATMETTEGLVSVGMDDVHLWDVDDPYLYDLRIAYDKDEVNSYTAFRTVGVEEDSAGVRRFCLNHKPLFVRGLLDQGYWPDGLMTAPSDDALVFDIQTARSAGFNMLRKHIKVESERWYWHCDRLGMLVWQDMVSGGDLPGEWSSANIPTLFRRSWTSYPDTQPRNWRRLGAADIAYREEWLSTARATIEHLKPHPSIATWVVFNESWGQYLSAQNTEKLRAVDDSRPFVATSGWYDQGAGDYCAVHNYFRSMRVYDDPHNRAFLINEFGGLNYSVEGHTSVSTVYGYDVYETASAWQTALYNLLGEVDALEGFGLSGFVYTQLCDVEEETNGLLTYDRRINKLLQ